MTDAADGAWWDIDLAAFLLTNIEFLDGMNPPSFSKQRAADWIRNTEISWAPSFGLDPPDEWDALGRLSDDWDLVDGTLSRAANEWSALRDGLDSDICSLAIRRRLPLSIVASYGMDVGQRTPDGSKCADGHIHQGAALPFELIIRWVARQTTSIAKDSRSQLTMMTDASGIEFSPLPLLLLLRAVECNDSRWQSSVSLAINALSGEPDAWDELASKLYFDVPDERTPVWRELVEEKRLARQSGWSKRRLLVLFRIEGILHGAVTQKKPGLDIFVDLFESLAKLRRHKFSKSEYFCLSIEDQIANTANLVALELRFGSDIGRANELSVESLRSDYVAALEGYMAYSTKLEHPALVTFPFGLVKSIGCVSATSSRWRYNPEGIYRSVSTLIEFLSHYPEVSRFVDGIDVCGQEVAVPNWLFTPAFEQFGEYCRAVGSVTSFRFHAGEQYWTPLNGLRAISEFLRIDLPAEARRRIGHGLALAGNNWSCLLDEPLLDLLDDLLWLLGTYRDDLPNRVVRGLSRAAEELYEASRSGSGVGRRPSVEELSAAYFLRTDVGALMSIGFLSHFGGQLSFINATPAVSSNYVEQLLLEFLSDELINNPLGQHIKPELANSIEEQEFIWTRSQLEDVHEFLSEAYDVARKRVVEEVIFAGVVVEMCPTSNVLTGGVRGYASHPAKELIERGVRVTLNSDDPSMFHVWLGDELWLAEHGVGLGRNQLAGCIGLGLNTVAAGINQSRLSEELASAVGSLA